MGYNPRQIQWFSLISSYMSVLTHLAASAHIPVPYSHLEGIGLIDKYVGDKVSSRILKKKKKRAFIFLSFSIVEGRLKCNKMVPFFQQKLILPAVRRLVNKMPLLNSLRNT